MYFTYGGFRHTENEVNLTRMDVRRRRSPRGKSLSEVVTLYLEGEFCESSQSAINAKVQEIIDAYQYDYQSAGLYLDDDTPTPHRLDNDDPNNMTGVHIIHRSWHKGGPAEFATTRSYQIVLQAEFAIADADAQIVQWSETLEFIGTGGPRFEVVETFFGPYSFVTALATPQTIIQSGSSVGFNGYVLPLGPMFPAIEHQDRRRIVSGAPKMQGRYACYYPMSWTYYFTATTPQGGVPIAR